MSVQLLREIYFEFRGSVVPELLFPATAAQRPAGVVSQFDKRAICTLFYDFIFMCLYGCH